MKNFKLTAALSFLLLQACSKSSPSPNNNLSSSNQITQFSFLQANNNIPVSSNGTINGLAIQIFLPPGTEKTGLKASFTNSAGTTVTVNGEEQTSGVTAEDFTNPVTYTVKAQNGTTENYTVTLITDIAGIDNAVSGFMTNYSIPGLSIAITYNENLVYVKSYGYAITETNQPVTNQNLFRIASLSKQITSIAIMKLMDQGRILPSDTVFGPRGILDTLYGTQPYGPFITDITVYELLHHTEGGWPNDATDPMFTNPTMTAAQLISWTLDNRPLSNVPGTTYAYSNFGYCILGRVIEKITGMPYAQAVDSLVLQSCGVTDMTIAGNLLSNRLPNEVEYYAQSGDGSPYDFNITRMDSHGGWLASATDLARILVRVDGFSNKQDILSTAAIDTMTTPSMANPEYACGWSVNSVNNWWHQGSLPGTATEQARTVSQGKFNFVILTNTRSLNSSFSGDLDNLFWNGLASTPAWPAYDLF